MKNCIVALLLALITLSGCAKSPSGPTTTGKQLVLTLKVRGRISPIDEYVPGRQRHYFVAIDNDGDNNTGPLAVYDASKGGNGWVTSDDAARSIGVTSFVQYDAANPQGYLYRILPGSNFQNTSSPQPLIQADVTDGGTTLRFVVDFSQIATASIPAGQIRSLNINFITTDAMYVSGSPGSRQYDGLGPTGQDYVTVDTTIDRRYSGENLDGHFVSDADLDICYWSVEVQTVRTR